MMSLFSSFDSNYFPTSILIFTFFLLLVYNKIFKVSLVGMSMKIVTVNLSSFFYSLKPSMISKFFMSFCISLMMLMFILNFVSILPFNFAVTSQVSIVFCMSLGIWVAIVLYNLIYNCKGFISHCVPEGTPIYLTWFLFAIEIVSNSIRPITLMVRLVANVLAGHLLMILLSQISLSSVLVASAYMFLNLVEFFVALIQAYIFVTMVSLYHADLN